MQTPQPVPNSAQNGQAGSSTQPSLTNAAVQQKSNGPNPAMTSMQRAAASYQSTAAPQTTAAPPQAPQAPVGGIGQPGGKAFPGGPPAPVAGGGYEGPAYATPYGPASNEWLDSMSADLRKQSALTMQDQMRALRSQMAATPGMLDSGASAAATADLYRRGTGDLQSQISQAMLGQYNSERDRLAQAWATEGGWATQRDIAREGNAAQLQAAQMNQGAAQAAASASAAADRYAQDLRDKQFYADLALREKLGMGELDLNWGQLDLGQGQLGFDYYRTQMAMLQDLMSGAGSTGFDWSMFEGMTGPGWEQGTPPPAMP